MFLPASGGGDGVKKLKTFPKVIMSSFWSHVLNNPVKGTLRFSNFVLTPQPNYKFLEDF